MFFKKLAAAVALATTLSLGAGLAHAQTTSGALVGVVRDSSGAIIPNTTVSATNEATGVVYVGKTTASGEYRISNLLQGTYDLRTSVPGFTPSLLQGVAVSATSVETQDIVLSVSQSTTVEVSAQANVSIDTTTAQIGNTFSTKETQDLPSASIGLGVLNLSLLTPGVASSGGLGAGTGPSVAGQRPRNNNFTIEGTDNNNKTVTGPLLSVPNDAVSEFVLLQNVYSAQYGHSTGGQFNTIVLAGTNHVHGRLYEYFQNRNLNAVTSLQAINNRAQGINPDFQPRFDFNRYGGQLGGPILKDKLFLFSNFERQTTGQSAASTAFCSPTAAGFSTLDGMAFGSTTNYGVYKQYVPAAPNQAPVGGGTSCNDSKASGAGATILVANANGVSTPVAVGAVSVPLSNSFNSYLSTTSLDYTISQHDALRVRYVYNRFDTNDTSASFPAFFAPNPTRFQLISASEIHTFTPYLSNEFRLGYNRFFTALELPPAKFPGLTQFPQLIFYDFSTTTYLGPDASAPQSDLQNLYQAVESLTWVKGKHTLNFGVEGRKYIAPTVFVQRLRGDYEYSKLGLYLNDTSPDEVGLRNATPPGISPTYYGDQTSIYAYGNDDFRLTPTVTLNLGLRYEFTSVPASEKEQALNIAASVPGLITFGKPTPQYTNFAPRIGVAYAPDENTAIHAAFGINYDVLYDNIGTTTAPPQFQTTESVNTQVATPGFLAGGGLPANTTFASLAQQRAATTGFVPNQKLPYSEQWTLGIQHVFHHDYTAEIRYVGTRGVHLDVQDQINVQSPVTAATELPTNLTGGAVTFNPANTLAALKAPVNGLPSYRVQAFGAAGLTSTITSDAPIGGSNYNGLQTQLTRRLQNGLLINASYTYSRAFDDSTADFNSTALNPRRPQDSQNLRAEYSRSDLDRPNRLTIAAVYDVPFFKSSGFLMKNLVGNWEIAPAYIFQSPQYTTVQSATDSNLNNDSAGDRVFINPNGKKGTGTGVVALINTAVACSGSTSTVGVANGTSTVVPSCAANTIGYTAGSISGTGSSAVFTPSNAYYVQGGPGTNPTASRNTLPTGRTNDLDVSAFKRIAFGDRYKFEFGAQAVNALNHSQYFPGSLNTVSSIGSTGSRNFDTVTNTQFNQKQLVFSNNPRTLQLSGKIIF